MSVVMAMEGVNLSFKIGSGPRAAHKQVLDNLSFAVRRGEAFGFLVPAWPARLRPPRPTPPLRPGPDG